MRTKLAALAVLVLALAAAPALARSSHAAPRTLYSPGDHDGILGSAWCGRISPKVCLGP
jgi:hypothetical protein